MKKFVSLLLALVVFTVPVFTTQSHYSNLNKNAAWAQSDLSPLDVLILDLQEVKRLIEEGDNKAAIVILKSSLGQVRRVKEFDKSTKKTTEKKIKKGIKLLKKDKNEEALDLLQTAFDALEESGLVEPGTLG